MVNKLYIDKTKIETRDNANNIKFSSNYKYLKSNAQNSTQVSGVVSTRLAHGNSYDDGYVATKQIGVSCCTYCTNFGSISTGTAWDMIHFLDSALDTPYTPHTVQPLGLPQAVGAYNNANYGKVYKLNGSTWTEVQSWTVVSQYRIFNPQPGFGDPVAQQTFILASGYHLPTAFAAHGTGYYKTSILSGWTGYANCLIVLPVYYQTQTSKLINAEITP